MKNLLFVAILLSISTCVKAESWDGGYWDREHAQSQAQFSQRMHQLEMERQLKQQQRLMQNQLIQQQLDMQQQLDQMKKQQSKGVGFLCKNAMAEGDSLGIRVHCN